MAKRQRVFQRGKEYEITGAGKRHRLARKIQSEVVTALAEPVDISHAFDEIDHRDTLAGIIQAQGAEFYLAVGSETERAAILKLNLGAAIVARLYLHALCDGKIEESALKSHARVFVDLHRTLNVTQANNASLRISHSGQRKKRAGHSRQNNQTELS